MEILSYLLEIRRCDGVSLVHHRENRVLSSRLLLLGCLSCRHSASAPSMEAVGSQQHVPRLIGPRHP